MEIYLLAGLAIWLAVLTFFIFRISRHYQNLVRRTQKRSIDEILNTLLANDKKFEDELNKSKKEIAQMAVESVGHLQRIGLIRFNPFKIWGTDQSFVLALLDKENNGVVINFIYTKEGLRVYTKKVKTGKGREYDLSDEEKKAIEKSSENL